MKRVQSIICVICKKTQTILVLPVVYNLQSHGANQASIVFDWWSTGFRRKSQEINHFLKHFACNLFQNIHFNGSYLVRRDSHLARNEARAGNLLWAVLYYQHEINMSHFLSSSSSHTQASKSRWFVGSSSNRSVGLTNRARAKAILIRQPPEKSFVFVCCMEGVKPRPSRISAALVSALSASRSSSLSKISNNLKEI